MARGESENTCLPGQPAFRRGVARMARFCIAQFASTPGSTRAAGRYRGRYGGRTKRATNERAPSHPHPSDASRAGSRPASARRVPPGARRTARRRRPNQPRPASQASPAQPRPACTRTVQWTVGYDANLGIAEATPPVRQSHGRGQLRRAMKKGGVWVEAPPMSSLPRFFRALDLP
jgi:hypothetical protein